MPSLDVIPRLAALPLEVARQAASLAVAVVRAVAGPVLGRRPDERDGGWQRTWEPPSSRPVGEPPPAPEPRPRPAEVRVPDALRPEPAPPPSEPVAPEPEAAPEPAPVHVDREAVVVAESSDPGAAEGAGATIHIGEPWSGYGRLKARDITAQLATADAAMLAVVRLYESTHRKRRTVLEEIDRRLPAAGD